MIRKSAEEEASESASKSKGIGVPLTISKSPSSQIIGRKVVSEVSVTASECDGITKDGAADGITCRRLASVDVEGGYTKKNLPGQRPAPSTRGFASSACNPTYNSR